MDGIDLNNEMKYISSSLRFFAEKEQHITRHCKDDVLLLVYEGVLRFTEDGKSYAVHPGEYHIQKHDTYQTGEVPSDSPQYLYVHFRASWSEGDFVLPKRGTFDYAKLKADMEEMNRLAYSHAPYIRKAEVFYRILSKLNSRETEDSPAVRIAGFIDANFREELTLELLCGKFAFSKNHIINIFKKKYNQTPVAYLNSVRIRHAEQLLIATSKSMEEIAYGCGYRNYSHFYRQFVRKNGKSPEKYRHQSRMGA